MTKKLHVIYEPKGNAGEYNSLACNLYNGCDHGCSYCYSPRVLHKTRESFRFNVKPRKQILEKLLLDAGTLQNQNITDSILLCFTCDPYCHAERTYRTTRQALKILLSHGLNVTILTKGGLRSEDDFDLLEKYPNQVTYATSLTTNNEYERNLYEPHAAPAEERINALKNAKRIGLKTWVSCEPVLNPITTLLLINRAAPYTDLFKIGKWNYDKDANKINWNAFVEDAINICNKLNKPYYIKKDLLPYLPDKV